MSSLVVVRSIEPDEYAHFLTDVPVRGASLFHDPLWVTVICRSFRVKPIFLGIYEQRQLIGVVPGFWSVRFPFSIFGSPMRGTNTPYLGPVLLRDHPGLSSDHLEELRRYLQVTWGFNYIEISLSSSSLLEELSPAGWQIEQSETFVVPLIGGPHRLWTKLEGRCRNMIRKAEKMGVTVSSRHGPDIIEIFYELLVKTFARRHLAPPHPKTFYVEAYETLYPSGRLEVLSAVYDRRVIAVGLFPHDEYQVYFLSGASDAQYHSVAPNNLLHWELIKWATVRGLCRYDMGGKGILSIDKFKESFGPQVDVCPRLWFADTLARIGREVFTRAIPIMRKASYFRSKLLRATKRQDLPNPSISQGGDG